MKKTFRYKLLITCLFLVLPILCSNDKVKSNNDVLSLTINPFGNEISSVDSVSLFKKDSEYCLFLPSNCDENKLTAYFNYSKSVYVDGKEIKNGEVTNAFSKVGKRVKVKCGSKTYFVKIYKSENLPSMFINTELSIDYLNEDKSNKTSGNIRTYDGSTMTLDCAFKQIKGRGNSSWNLPKKSYNLKFDKKTELLGMEKAKKWCMLPSYADPAMDKNAFGWELANQIGISYSSDYRFSDLYINNDYYGTYIICENVEIGESRVNITDLAKETEKVNEGFNLEDFSRGGSFEEWNEDDYYNFPYARWVNIPNDPTDISGGYLLEFDYTSRLKEEISFFSTTRGQSVVLKEPEYASEAQVKYIRNYYQEAEDAICGLGGYNTIGKHYSEYFDMDSLVNSYIFLELSGNYDAGISSLFFYKDTNGKLVCGPTWDNDPGFGNFAKKNSSLCNDPSVYVANRMSYGLRKTMKTNDEYPTIFNRLYRQSDFRSLVNDRWLELNNVINISNIKNILQDIQTLTKASCLMNADRWYSHFPNLLYYGSCELAGSYLEKRIEYLNNGFSEQGAQLYYDANGGIGWSIENSILKNGDKKIVKGPYCNYKHKSNYEEFLPPFDGVYFIGWNTKADGSGVSYKPGQIITVNGNITLYAQWSENKTDYCSLVKYIDSPIIKFAKSIFSVLEMLF